MSDNADHRPTKRRRTNESSEDETIVVQPRSSGREKRKPRRYSVEVEEIQAVPLEAKSRGKSVKQKLDTEINDAIASPQPKGILTPSGRKGTRSRKSVVFEEKELGFRDIDSSVKTYRKTPKGKLLAEKQLNANAEVIARSEEENGLEEDLDVDIVTDAVELPGLEVQEGAIDHEVEEDPDLIAIKSIVLSRITSTSLQPSRDEQYETLQNILSATVVSGESNSLLLLGARGSGKSLLLETAIKELGTDHGDDFHTIRLNGFFQTDDKLALREIWRQLGREMEVSEDENGDISSYADTMTSLLSLLSHPEDLQHPDQMQTDGPHLTTKSVIFILDEFDLFTTHPRQTLLYNLFDIAQSRKAPIAVIGCSTRMDVVESLEKRVKSRFSHRWLHVSNAKSLPAFEEAIASTLTISSTKSLFGAIRTDQQNVEKWNQHVKTIFLPSPEVQTLIKQTYHTSKSLPDILMALYPAIVGLSLSNNASQVSKTGLSATASLVSPVPSILTTLQHLPNVHLSLLIAAARLEAIHNMISSNFNLVYSQYHDLVSRSRLQRSASGVIATGAGSKLWSRDVCRDAWEDLGNWELIVPVSGGFNGPLGTGGGNPADMAGEYAMARMWRVDVTLEEIGWAVKEKFGTVGPGEILGKWCREI